MLERLLRGEIAYEVLTGDCLQLLRELPDESVDFIMGSPPYEDARWYGDVKFSLKGEEWVRWMVAIVTECVRVSRGLVAIVCNGRTKSWAYSGVPFLLYADCMRAGIVTRMPGVFQRDGIPGGSPDFWRNGWEPILYFTHARRRLPFVDITALGHTPRWAPGGAMSYRLTDGTKRNQWGRARSSRGSRRQNGKRDPVAHPSHRYFIRADLAAFRQTGQMTVRRRDKEGNDTIEFQHYVPPAKAKPNNVIHCLVGGNQMGSKLCHRNEAPYPERLVEYHVPTFCPEFGLVLDPWCGSGTTLAVAVRHRRRALGIDLRADQAALTSSRVDQEVKWFDMLDLQKHVSSTNGVAL